MKNYLIIGPDHTQSNVNNTIKSLSQIDSKRVIYGNGKKSVACKSIKLANNSNLTIRAHGTKTSEDIYKIKLCGDNKPFSDVIQQITSGKILNIELFSCFSGAGINAAASLEPGSTLTTFTSKSSNSVLSLDDEILDQSTKFKHGYNAFIKLASYIFVTPDDIHFAIRTTKKTKVFFSPISLLKKFSSQDILERLNNVLEQFLNFCKNIIEETTTEHSKQITELLNLFDDTQYKGTWSDQFDIKRYQELLLISMSQKGNLLVVQALLNNLSINVNAKLYDHSSALSLAVYKGHGEVVKELINAGADVNIKDDHSVSPLCKAIESGYTEIVEILINAGADVNIKDSKNLSPLHFAAEKGYTKIVQSLINAGANVNVKDNNAVSPLFFAIQGGHINVIKDLIESGVRLNEKNNLGDSALHIAVINEHLEIVQILIKYGSSLNVLNDDGISPLFQAIATGNINIVKTLAQSGSLITGKLHGYSALDMACDTEHIQINNIKMVQALLANGADTSESTEWKKSSKNIIKSIGIYNKDPIKFILENHEEAKFALNAIKNLGTQTNFMATHKTELDLTKDCLTHQPDGAWNLIEICGSNGSYYQQDEL